MNKKIFSESENEKNKFKITTNETIKRFINMVKKTLYK